MEVEYTLQPQDMMAFTRHEIARARQPAKGSGRESIIPVVIAVLLGLFFIYVPGAMEISLRFIDSVYPSFLGFLAGVFLAGVAVAILIFLAVGKPSFSKIKSHLDDPHNRWATGPWRVSFSAEGLARTSESATMIYRWSIVWKIDTTADHAFFYVAKEESVIVPMRAFRDPQQFDEFLALARRYREGKPQSTGITTAPAPSTAITRDLP